MQVDPHPPVSAVREAVDRALAEDLTPLGDVTAALVPESAAGRGVIAARADGVLAGTRCAAETFARVEPAVRVEWDLSDGDIVTSGDFIARVDGPLAGILTAERTALNFLGHLSGIATLTRRFVDAAGHDVTILDTRKTTPGLRAIEKAAVRAGGGANHRGNLSEWVMLKDNHLVALGIAEAVARARAAWPLRTVQVECDAFDQVVEALEAGVDAMLLDNMSTDEVRRCVKEARSREGGHAWLEASGGITLENVAAYADTGVDVISTSAITNSAPVLDLGLDLTEVRAQE
jgi:nicotinate-nucleotide pyrophosphorylase (carboxylating)